MGASYTDQQAFIQKFYEQAFAITASKGQDYTPDGISLLELLPTCVEADILPPQALWALYRKGFSAITKHFFHNQSLLTEPVALRLQDAANYFALLAWYDAHKVEIHKAWWEYWEGKSCACGFDRATLQRDTCQRCATLLWMAKRVYDPDSNRN